MSSRKPSSRKRQIAALLFFFLVILGATRLTVGALTWDLPSQLQWFRGVKFADDSFGAFTTLVSLAYATLLGQMVGYYFTRQGTIQDCLFKEIALLQRFQATVEQRLKRHERPPWTALFRKRRQTIAWYLRDFGGMVLGSLALSDDGAQVVDTRMTNLYKVAALTVVADDEVHYGSAFAFELTALEQCLTRLTEVRSDRISAMLAPLPRVQTFLLRFLALVLLTAFVLLRDAHPEHGWAESVLTGVLVTVFFFLDAIIADLSDPFSGFWNTGPAKEALVKLLGDIDLMKEQQQTKKSSREEKAR